MTMAATATVAEAESPESGIQETIDQIFKLRYAAAVNEMERLAVKVERTEPSRDCSDISDWQELITASGTASKWPRTAAYPPSSSTTSSLKPTTSRPT